MERITYYKLQSPYSDDITKDCKLTMNEIDENFFNLKNNDISAATYNSSGMTLNIIKNDGDMINVDLSDLRYNIDNEINKKISGITKGESYEYYIGASLDESLTEGLIEELNKYSGSSATLYNTVSTNVNEHIWLLLPEPIKLNYWLENGIPVSASEQGTIIINDKEYNCYRNVAKLDDNTWNLTISTKDSGFDETGIEDIQLTGNLLDNGILTLNWKTISGTSFTSVSGFVTSISVAHSGQFVGDGSKKSPLRLNNLECHGFYNNVLGIADELPTSNLKNGDRYITTTKQSNFGCLYNKQGMLTIENELRKLNSPWRIPTKSDWDKVLNYCEVCDEDCQHDGTDINIEYGKLAGKTLKSIKYWDANKNLDKYSFTIYPVGVSNNEQELTSDGILAPYWTITPYDTENTFIKAFKANLNGISQEASKDNEKYAIRLVADDYGSGLEEAINLFGENYDVVIFKELNQIWINRNLDYYIDSNRCDKFEYEHATINNIKLINHWNGEYWEQKTLICGDVINIINDDVVTNYQLNSQNELIKQKTIQTDISGNTLTKIDSGWY